jgi:glutamine synthetase
MEIMRQQATQLDLSLLLHEKPFAHINGSGKHANWSLMTSTGLNLLDPTDTPENNLHFLILLVAILNAIYKHNALVRASVGSASNDDRLGGHEAPPAIISVYLGQELEAVLDNIEIKGDHVSPKSKKKYDFGLSIIPDLHKDQTDRNRTSPFAFTGNKFEFRAVGSSQNPAFAITILNAIVAESLHEILDEIEKKSKNSKAKLVKATMEVLQQSIKKCKGIRFTGDNYSHAWEVEAKKRGLANHKNSLQSFEAIIDPKTKKAFKGILTEQELQARYEIMVEQYRANVEIEAKLLIELFRTALLPAAVKTVKEQEGVLDSLPLKELIHQGIQEVDRLEELLSSKESPQIKDQCKTARSVIDRIEGLTDDTFWPLPKYRELLWLV